MRDLYRVLMKNPAKIFGLFPKKGVLTLGSDADIVILNPHEKWTVKGGNLHTTAKWTPYEDMELTGKVETTIVRGKVVYHKGEIIGEKGHGKFIRPL